MPLNTVHHYLKRLLDGVQVPGTAGTLEAFITPPDPETEPTPKAYIWGATANEQRTAMPRNLNGDPTTAGWKQMDHLIDVWLVWFSDEETDAPDLDSAFPAVLDVVSKILRESQDPVQVSDPLTGQPSELLDVGEKMSTEMYPPRSVADQRILRYDARFQLTIQEVFQA